MSQARRKQVIFCTRCEQLYDPEEVWWRDGLWRCPTPSCSGGGIGTGMGAEYEAWRERNGLEPDPELSLALAFARWYCSLTDPWRPVYLTPAKPETKAKTEGEGVKEGV